MLSSSIPLRFKSPFAQSASGPYITFPIPDTTAAPGRAALDTGFPPSTFTPRGSGGTPPFGQDFNGLMKQVTQWAQWQAAGAPVFYDSAFSTAVGGYPKGAILASSVTAGRSWYNTVENNTTNPDTGGANWTIIDDVPAYSASNFTGYFRIPNTPFMVQYMTVNCPAGGGSTVDVPTGMLWWNIGTVTFPVAFPNNCIAYTGFASQIVSDNYFAIVQANRGPTNLTQVFVVRNNNAPGIQILPMTFVAIGY